jgi:hydroxyacylglutathione hydrolase
VAGSRRSAAVDAHGRRVDVRQSAEFAAGHVPGAVHLELGMLRQAVDDLPPGPLVVMCGHGERAATAASLLESAGRTDVAVLAGGPEDWARSTGRQLVAW